jgi:FkbM family methyltransferase
MIKQFLNRTLKQIGRDLGLEIRRLKSSIGVMEGFLQHLRVVGFKPSSVLDVGANKAEWAQLAQRFFPEAKFILIEPQMELEPHLKAFCDKSPGSVWKLAGAGREPGEMELIVWSDSTRSSVLFRPEKDSPRELRRIPIITIDSLFENAKDVPQLAKLDIQGYELEALAGATKLFGHTECFIVEVNMYERVATVPQFSDVVSFFADRGYKVYDIPGDLRRPLDNALWAVDLAFVRKGGMFDTYKTWGK